jgi:Tol biopolymer transport system component
VTRAVLAALAGLALCPFGMVQVPPAEGWSHARQAGARVAPVDPPALALSADGRYLAFVSQAALARGDTTTCRDVYVLDRTTGTVTWETSSYPGTVADGDSGSPEISADGRVIVFVSTAGNLVVPALTPGTSRVFLRDRATATTTLVSHRDQTLGLGRASRPSLSDDGAAVAYEATPSGGAPIIVLARAGQPDEVVSVTTSGERRPGQSVTPTISGDGGRIVFMSRADLTTAPQAPDRNGYADVYLRDVRARTTVRISVGREHSDPDGASYHPAISGDGRVVAFVSEATTLVRDAGPRLPRIYVHDVASGEMALIGRTTNAAGARAPSLYPALSHDGSIVAFQSLAVLTCFSECGTAIRDENLLWDVFVHDRRAATTAIVSADQVEAWSGRGPALDGSGRVIAFSSRRPIDASDVSDDEDAYVRASSAPSSRRGGG